MGKKKGGSSGKGAANKPKPTKSPFAVASAKNKKKPKEVKSNLKKVIPKISHNFKTLLNIS